MRIVYRQGGVPIYWPIAQIFITTIRCRPFGEAHQARLSARSMTSQMSLKTSLTPSCTPWAPFCVQWPIETHSPGHLTQLRWPHMIAQSLVWKATHTYPRWVSKTKSLSVCLCLSNWLRFAFISFNIDIFVLFSLCLFFTESSMSFLTQPF